MDNYKLLEERIVKLEKIVFGETEVKFDKKIKAKTLQELKKNLIFANGQERVIFIIGYLELILKMESITQKDIRLKWREGKFKGKFNSNFLQRAYSDAHIRKEKEKYDLTTTGEIFFNEMMDNNK